MTLTLMGTILEGAVERELILRNPAQGRARRVKEPRPTRSYLDSADQIHALLEAAARIDSTAREKHVQRRAILMTLSFAGLRIGELCSLRWRDVDLSSGWLTVSVSKTDAGIRKVKIRDALRGELQRIRPADADPDNFVFDLAARGLNPLPERVTPHSLRRTFASILCAIGEPATIAMAELGHISPNLTLRVYAQAMRRDEPEVQSLRELINGSSTDPAQLANIGRREILSLAS